MEEKIIERADRKLFLDAAVIQQGRLLDKVKGSLTKGEVMAMVRCVDRLIIHCGDLSVSVG